jgi:diguanylate cyclase (GGDEF)-like protein
MTTARSRERVPRRDRVTRWPRALRGAALAVMLAGILASVWVAKGWQSTVTRQRDERLDRTKTARTTTIRSALGQYENALQAARSLWLASAHVSRKDFNTFARSLDLENRYPGLQNISWREVVRQQDAAQFVGQARAEGEDGFTIRPPGRRPVYYVTRYSYPLSPFGSRVGLDARAIPGILASVELARDTGVTTLSNQTTLADDLWLPSAERPVAYELFTPVYSTDAPFDSVAKRRDEFRGWASGQFRAADLLEPALRTSTQPTGVELHDEEVGPASLVASFPPGFRAEGSYVRQDTLVFGGRTFLLRYAPLPGNAVLTERTIPAPVVLGTGVAVSLLLGALLWLLVQVGALYREVERLARTDGLTGVANRRAWDDELPRELARAARSGQQLCVALLDLDHFKAYNDRHGHQAGDRLLKAAAAAWQGRLRRTDLLTRYGGEEFAVLLPDCDLPNAMEIAERLRTAQPEITCSLGVAAWDGREAVTELVARADRALYAAKAAGRDRSYAAPGATAASAAAQAPTS